MAGGLGPYAMRRGCFNDTTLQRRILLRAWTEMARSVLMLCAKRGRLALIAMGNKHDHGWGLRPRSPLNFSGLWAVACVPRVRTKVCIWMMLDDRISNCMPSDTHILRYIRNYHQSRSINLCTVPPMTHIAGNAA